MSTYITKKFFSFYHSKNNRSELVFNLGKSKADRPQDRFLKFEWSFHKDIHCSTYLEREENKITLGVQFLFFSLFTTYSGLINYIIKSNQTWRYSLSIHGWILWWVLGCEPHSWNSSDGWRNSNFDFLDFLFGKLKHDKKNLEELSHTLKLPEGDYEIEMKFEDFISWRKRVPKFVWERKIRRVDLKITPEIPYPGKNDPVGSYSQISFPAEDIQEVLSKVYEDIEKKRRGDIGYYNNEYRKVMDNYTYTINGLDINLGRVPVEKRNGEWQPLGYSTARAADETFRQLTKKKNPLTNEELGFINKYMGRINSIDFIKESTQDDIQKEMENYFRTRQQEVIGYGLGDTSCSVPKQG